MFFGLIALLIARTALLLIAFAPLFALATFLLLCWAGLLALWGFTFL